jgi:RHS repeat-associated protein
MGTSASAPSNLISPTQGGGALKGIGESFSADPHTGTGNFSVPLVLPPGRNGFQPALRLEYSTGNGNGPFGFGWRLNVPGVARKTSKGIPQYHDETDVFVLSGAEDLVPVEDLATDAPSALRTRFQPRTEGLFAHIVHVRSALETYWEVVTKDGLTSRYGTQRPVGSPQDWIDPAALADPVDPKRVAAWRLSETRDVFGNRIVYDYERDGDGTVDRPWSQSYLRRIRYVDFGDAEASAQFLVSVDFIYEARPDPFSDYRSAFEIRTAQRCKRIEVRTHADVDLLARAYEFVYLDERVDLSGLALLLPPNKASLLSQIRMVGIDGDLTEDLPPLEFSYTHFEPRNRKFFPVIGKEMPPFSLAHPDVELADLFGSGLPDIVEISNSVRYWRNLGDGSFDLPRDMPTAPAGLRLSDRGVQLLDADGDGRIDLLVTSQAMAGYFPMRFDGEWDRRSFHRYRQAPSFGLKDPEVRLLDLDGDGVTDALRSGERLEAFFNDPEKGWTRTRRIERKALVDFPNVDFSDPRVKWDDMSGDGLQDIVLVHDGVCVYWPNLGYGNWARPVYMRNSPRLPYGYDPRRILLGDVDGDGAADIVYVDDKQVTLWINQSGNGWSEPVVIAGTPPVSDMDAVRLVDVLGSGVAGLLWSRDFSAPPHESLDFLDFTGGVKPYLLNEMDNHIGAVTRVGYASSTRFFVVDRKKPATRWRTPLPFPIQVVHRVEVIDELSLGKLTTEFAYHHGYWDGVEREFRGFGMVEQFDTETFDLYNRAGLHGDGAAFGRVADPQRFSPPTCTRTWFHQGPVGGESSDWTELDLRGDFWPGDPGLLDHKRGVDRFLRTLDARRIRRDALRALRGGVLRSELYAVDGTARADRPYTVTEHAYGLRKESVSLDSDARVVFFPHRTATRVTQWERGDDPLTRFTFTDTHDYDAFGQLQRSTSIACPRGWRGNDDRPSQRYLATRTRTTYVEAGVGGRIHDRVARATSYELSASGARTVEDLHRLPDSDPSLRLIGQTNHYYDGPAFVGLASGLIGAYGALTRSESLVLTDAILEDAYRSGRVVSVPPELPPYLDTAGPPQWTPEYPSEFRSLLPPLAGYAFHPGGPQPDDARGYFAQTERRSYDFQQDAGNTGHGLVLRMLDPLGHAASVSYDRFDLLPVSVTDAAQLVTQAEYDYRVLQGRLITDPNGNSSTFNFTPLGLLKQAFIHGKRGEGDQTQPSVSMTYDFQAFIVSKFVDPSNPQPIYVHSARRVHHDAEANVPQPERDETIESRVYSDGFGRLLQTRAQAEDVLYGDDTFGGGLVPADQGDTAGTEQPVLGRQRNVGDPPNVTVSGWQIYDNKGRVVEKYEPLYSIGYGYTEPSDRERGQKVEMFYEPRGNLVRTLNPDGSEQRVVFGVPGSIAVPSLDDPDLFEPTPWEAYTYDANDNAGRTDPVAAGSYRHHWDTPASILIDALGRTVLAIERNRDKPANPGDPMPPMSELRTASDYDIRDNVLRITDALGRLAFAHVYDLANRPLRVESVDAGIRRTVPDAAGNPIEGRDTKGAFILRAYDAMNRPTRLWARDATGESVSLRELIIYGDDRLVGPSPQQAAEGNLLGKPYRAYDEAGRMSYEHYDFKGNLLDKFRQVIADDVILSVFNPPPPDWNIRAYRVDWQLNGAPNLGARAMSLLDPAEYRTTAHYDALNRVQTLLYPQDVSGRRKTFRHRYNHAGALESVSLDSAAYVVRIAYNAKGQRALIAYGNGVMTRYAYDPMTFRVTRMRSEGYAHPSEVTFSPVGAALQDFGYKYDVVGNVLRIQDRTPGSGIANTSLGRDALDRDFSYDPLYRLLAANGRECDLPPDLPWDDRPRCIDLTRTRPYNESYLYDDAGNISRLAHTANRVFTLVSNTNRIATVSVGQTDYAYAYDGSGNLIGETTSRHFEWDHSNRMRAFRTQTDGADPTLHAQYLYDSDGQRVKKLARRQGGQADSTVYVDSLFELHRTGRGVSLRQNNSLHVMDDRSRIALVRVGVPVSDDRSPAVKYQLGDHLGSANVVVGGVSATASDFISREEYTPYGETSFGGFAHKRYRFTGTERDEESGLCYHGARYCLIWLGRWASSDPLGRVDGLNLYSYARNRPLLLTDTAGTDADVSADTLTSDLADGTNTQIPPATGTQRDFSLETDSVRIQAAAGTAELPVEAEDPEPDRELELSAGVGGKVVTPQGHSAQRSSVASQSVEATVKLDEKTELKLTYESTQEQSSPPSPLNANKKAQKFEFGASFGLKVREDLKGYVGPLVDFQSGEAPGAPQMTFFRGKAEVEYERKLGPKPPTRILNGAPRTPPDPGLKLSLKGAFEFGGGDNLLEGALEVKLTRTWNAGKNIWFGIAGGAEGKYSPPVGRDPTSFELQIKAGLVVGF